MTMAEAEARNCAASAAAAPRVWLFTRITSGDFFAANHFTAASAPLSPPAKRRSKTVPVVRPGGWLARS